MTVHYFLESVFCVAYIYLIHQKVTQVGLEYFLFLHVIFIGLSNQFNISNNVIVNIIFDKVLGSTQQEIQTGWIFQTEYTAPTDHKTQIPKIYSLMTN